MHFKVGEVHTAFHSLRVRVSAEQGRLEKLQEGNQLRETKQVFQRNPPEKETIKVDLERRLSSEIQFYSGLTTKVFSFVHIAVVLLFYLLLLIKIPHYRLLIRKYMTKRICPLKMVSKCAGAVKTAKFI